MKNVQCLFIDPQMDFCVPNGTFNVPTGALLVDGAYDDMKRLSTWVKKNASHISDIHITLDSHHFLDCAHPSFWKDSKGKHPTPFTLISYSDIESGKWTPVLPALYSRMLDYTKKLEDNKRYPLIIWPPHCLIGSTGAAVVPELLEAVNDWAVLKNSTVDFVTKGSNPFTEHYSAVKAEVPDPSDPSTQLNSELIKTIEQADLLVWAGEAGSHCVRNTMIDTFEAFGVDSIKKSVILTDCVSPVKGFEKEQTEFLKEYSNKGLKLSTTKDLVL